MHIKNIKDLANHQGSQEQGKIWQLKDQTSTYLREMVVRLEKLQNNSIKTLQEAKSELQNLDEYIGEIKKVKCWYFVTDSDGVIFTQAARIEPEVVRLHHRSSASDASREFALDSPEEFVSATPEESISVDYNVRNSDDIPVYAQRDTAPGDKLVASLEIKSTNGFELIVFEVYNYIKNLPVQTEKLICRRNLDPEHEYFEHYPFSANSSEHTLSYLTRINTVAAVTLQSLHNGQYYEALDIHNIQTLKAIKKIIAENNNLNLRDFESFPYIVRALFFIATFDQDEEADIEAIKEQNVFKIRIATSYLYKHNFPLLRTMLEVVSQRKLDEYLECVFDLQEGQLLYCSQGVAINHNDGKIRDEVLKSLKLSLVPFKELIQLLQAAVMHVFEKTAKSPESTALMISDIQETTKVKEFFLFDALFAYLKKLSSRKDHNAIYPYCELLTKHLISLFKPKHLTNTEMTKALYAALCIDKDITLLEVVVNAMHNAEDFAHALSMMILSNHNFELKNLKLETSKYQQLQGDDLTLVLKTMIDKGNCYALDLRKLKLETSKYYQQLRGHDLAQIIVAMINTNVTEHDFYKHQNYEALTSTESIIMILAMLEKDIALDIQLIIKFRDYCLRLKKIQKLAKSLERLPIIQQTIFTHLFACIKHTDSGEEFCHWRLEYAPNSTKETTYNLARVVAGGDLGVLFKIMLKIHGKDLTINMMSTDIYYIKQLTYNFLGVCELYDCCLKVNNFTLIEKLGTDYLAEKFNTCKINDLLGAICKLYDAHMQSVKFIRILDLFDNKIFQKVIKDFAALDKAITVITQKYSPKEGVLILGKLDANYIGQLIKHLHDLKHIFDLATTENIAQVINYLGGTSGLKSILCTLINTTTANDLGDFLSLLPKTIKIADLLDEKIIRQVISNAADINKLLASARENWSQLLDYINTIDYIQAIMVDMAELQIKTANETTSTSDYEELPRPSRRQ